MRRLALLTVLALSSGVAAGVTLEQARERVEALDRLLRRPKAGNAELVAAVEAVGEACADLDAAGDPREKEKLRDQAAAVLLKALRLERVEEAAKRNLRSDVQFAAAAALRHVRREDARDLMRVIERHLLDDRGYDVDPSFHDAILDPLVRLDAKGTFEWILEEVVSADADADSRDRALAGIDALLRLPATGEQRRLAVRRMLAIYYAFEQLEDERFDVAGCRGLSIKYPPVVALGPYWVAMRPTVMRALRELSTDPRTGLPPLDVDRGGEIATVGRFKVWFSKNQTAGMTPWIDGRGPPVRARDAVPPTRSLPPAWRAFGAPWMDAWQRNRDILDRPVAPATWREELRTLTLPPVLAKALADPAWEVRAAAAITLGRIAAADASPRLHERLDRDPVEAVREAALLGLLLLGDAKERDFLRARASDVGENPRVRAYAVLALGFLGDEAALRLEWEGPRETRSDLGACAVRGLGLARCAAGDLAAVLADRRAPAPVRGEAGTALLDLGDRSVLPAVLPVLGERVSRSGPAAQAAAAIAAGLVAPDDAKSLRRLGHALGDADDPFGGVRTLLAASLGRVGGPRATAMLADEYEGFHANSLRYGERGHFLLALGRAGTDEAVALLRRELETLDHDWDLGACALGLALAGDRASLSPLRTLLAERGELYAPHGMMALALLRDPAGASFVRDVVKERRAGAILEEGALALALLEGEKALPDLLALWERGRRPEHFDGFAWAFRIAAAAGAVAPLLAIVGKDGDANERAFALLALGRMADPAPVPPLNRLAHASNPYAGSPTLLDLARWRDAAPLLD